MISKFRKAIAAFEAETGWDLSRAAILVNEAQFKELESCFDLQGRPRIPALEVDGVLFLSAADYDIRVCS